MTRLSQVTVAAATILSFFTSAVSAQTATSDAAAAYQTLSCYSAIPSDWASKGDYTFQTSGYCQDQCKGYSLMAITGGKTCSCGNEYPDSTDVVSNSTCNTPCQGFDQLMCGGTNAWQLYTTGSGTPEGSAPGSSSGTSSSVSTKPSTTSSTVPSVVTQSGKVVTVTAEAAAGSSSSSSSKSGGGGSKIGIAVGVVVGVLVIAAIVGGLVLFLKRRRRLAIEEEHRRNAAVNGFVNGVKSETSSTTDARLDPAVFSHRRNSIGSIADEQDFSRRILQVS